MTAERSHPDQRRRPYLGYRSEDHETPFAKYFKEEMAPPAAHVVEAVTTGAQSPVLFADLDGAAGLLDEGHTAVETGYVLAPDGSIRINVLTPMPDVDPAMWDWWFGWHGEDTRRYKLWHPQAHLYADWADSDSGARSAARRSARERYVGRTSFIDEYIGSAITRAAIRFVPPSTLGFEEARLRPGADDLVVCARVGPSDRPVDIGYLVHHVRRAAGGAEMRSRFWLGGRHVAVRGSGPVVPAASQVLRRLVRLDARLAPGLLVHCAREMAHLAGFLPALYEEFGDP